MLGYPPTPSGSLAADRPTRRPKVWVNQGGGGSPPYSSQNGCTPLRVTHWLAAAPLLSTYGDLRSGHWAQVARALFLRNLQRCRCAGPGCKSRFGYALMRSSDLELSISF